jgi:MFS superfamily sulfate permease-like transporter
LDPEKRNTPTNRELKAQGLGNLVSGLIGGLPITAVIVRSSANISSGAKTKLSAIIHGIFLLSSVILFANILNQIPLASLAAVLFMVGYKLAKVSLFQSMYRLGWDQFLPFVVTVVAILFTDLLKGICIGMAVSIFFILRNNYRRPYFFTKSEHKEGDIITIELSEDVTFLNKGNMTNTLHHLPENSNVIIDGRKSRYIDIDVLEIIHTFNETAHLKKIDVKLINIPSFNGTQGH